MYRFSYADSGGEPADARDRQRQLLSRSIDLLVAASRKGSGARETAEAISFLNRIWTGFVNDLRHPGNALPAELRAHLTAIGLWLLREAEEIRQGRSDNFDGLIEVSGIIRDGIPSQAR